MYHLTPVFIGSSIALMLISHELRCVILQSGQWSITLPVLSTPLDVTLWALHPEQIKSPR